MNSIPFRSGLARLLRFLMKRIEYHSLLQSAGLSVESNSLTHPYFLTMKKLILAAFCLIVYVSAIYAQPEETGKNEFSVWGGFSPDSNTFIKAFGRTPDARFGIVAFRYARRFNTGDAVNIKYTADVVPAAFLNYPDVEVLSTIPPLARLTRPTRYGFGVAPLGLQANFRPRCLQPRLFSESCFPRWQSIASSQDRISRFRLSHTLPAAI